MCLNNSSCKMQLNIQANYMFINCKSCIKKSTSVISAIYIHIFISIAFLLIEIQKMQFLNDALVLLLGCVITKSPCEIDINVFQQSVPFKICMSNERGDETVQGLI